MLVFLFYFLAIIAILIGFGALYITMLENIDKSFPARTRIIGITVLEKGNIAYLKEEIMAKKIVRNKNHKFILFYVESAVIGFQTSLNKIDLDIVSTNNKLIDKKTKTEWDIRGSYISGKIDARLEPISFSDEYWFAWSKFHPNSEVIRLK